MQDLTRLAGLAELTPAPRVSLSVYVLNEGPRGLLCVCVCECVRESVWLDWEREVFHV